jgi:hypothetical protein
VCASKHRARRVHEPNIISPEDAQDMEEVRQSVEKTLRRKVPHRR